MTSASLQSRKKQVRCQADNIAHFIMQVLLAIMTTYWNIVRKFSV